MTKLATTLFFLLSTYTLAFGNNPDTDDGEMSQLPPAIVEDVIVTAEETEEPVLAEEAVVVIEVEAPVLAEETVVDESYVPEIRCEQEALIDQEVEIAVVGLRPNQAVSIEARWVGIDHVQWISSAQFRSDQNGVINLAEQAPLEGSYEGVDPMGLFWSMKMGNVVILENCDLGDEKVDCRGALKVNLKVLDENGVIAQKSICRGTLLPDVEVIELRENGLIGNLFIPSSEETLPVVIVLAGSEGGIPDGIAELMSSNGIAAFALAYSGVYDLPPDVENVELEYFERAFEWLQNHPRLNGKIAIWGASRGAELALLLGSMFPDSIDRIVAVAPSSVVLSPNAWLYKGEPVLPAAPFLVDFNYDFRNDVALRETPHVQKIHFERGIYLENERFEAASIPVEKIKCPIMLITGGDDQLGPCSIFAKQIFARLDRFHSKIEKTHLDYPKAGHLIGLPYLPRINLFFDEWRWINVGGTPYADELASRDAWEHTLEFLQD